jgi:FdhD protein
MSTSYARRPVAGKPADTLVVEEPLEIRLNGKPLAVTMRTPGSELDLALGFLYTEGIIGGPDQVKSAKLCIDNPNIVEVDAPSVDAEARNFYTTSSCGVCGKASIDSVRVHSHHDVAGDPTTVSGTCCAPCRPNSARHRRAFRVPEAPTPAASSPPRAGSSSPARTWGGTTPWTR